MSGLPAKYAKMGFAAGWKLYNADRSAAKRQAKKPKGKRASGVASYYHDLAGTKKKTVRKKRKTTARRMSGTTDFASPVLLGKAPRKRRKLGSVKRYYNNAFMGFDMKKGTKKIQEKAITVGLAIAGAVVGRALANNLPVKDERIKAAVPAILGLVSSALFGNRMIEAAGLGMAVSGGLSLATAMNIPYISGEDESITVQDVTNALNDGTITADEALLLTQGNDPDMLGSVERFGEDDSEDMYEPDFVTVEG